MRKAKSNLLPFLPILIIALIKQATSFQFMYMQVVFNPTIIKETAVYQFVLNREMTSNLSNTNWTSQLIPADSTVRITFPQQYQSSDLSNFSCDYVFLDGNPASGYNCNLNATNKQAILLSKSTIIISGLFPATVNVGIINVELSNIRNPAPSITTDPFLGFVGSDYSSNDNGASVFFEPAMLEGFNVTFSNPTVNTTSEMILSLEIRNYFPSGGHIELTFPTSLQWSRDLSLNHPFPINGILSCEGISSNLNTVITCLGQSATKIVAFTNLANSDIGPNTIITFKLKNMFSPPTTQTTNPSDALLVKTFDGNSNQIEYQQSFVSGLIPRNISTLQILPLGGQANFIVNTWVGLNFTFNVADTMDYNDYFQMIFPTSTNIIYSTSSTTFKFGGSGSTGVNFNSSNSTLTMFPNNNSPSQNINNFVFIGFKSYLAPTSCRIQSIQLNVMRYGYGKMTGSANIQAMTNKYYLQNLSLNNTEVNTNTMLTVNFQLKDVLSGTGMMVILMPQLIVQTAGSVSVQMSSSISTSGMINPTPSVTAYTSQQIIPSTTNTTSFTCPSLGGCLLLTNLTGTSSISTKPQNITMQIKGLQNIGYVTSIDVLGLRTFYDSQFDSRVAQLSQNSTAITLKTTNGMLSINSIQWNSGITNYQSTAVLSVSMTNQNPIPITGILLVFIPSQLFIQLSLLPNQSKLTLSLWINSLQQAVNQSFIVTNDTYYTTNATTNVVPTYCLKIDFSTINLTSLSTSYIPAGANITLAINILSTDSTQPLTVMNWYVQSFTQSMNMIDQFNPANNSNFIYKTITQNSLNNINLYRSTSNTANITTLTSIPSLDDCQQNAQLCSSYVFQMQQQQPFQLFTSVSNNKSIIQIQIGKNIDLSTTTNAYIAIQSQLVYYDFTTITRYTTNNGSSSILWLPINYTVHQIDNRTNAIVFEIPLGASLSSVNGLISTGYNRFTIPSTINAQNISSHVFVLLENVRNPFSLAPFMGTYKTEKSIQGLNTYLYSSGTTSMLRNTQLLNLTVTNFTFASRAYQQQSSLNFNISLNNWNQASSPSSIKNSSNNNVRYIILAVGKGFTFPNISSLGFCVTTINNYTENASCSIEQISPNFTWTQKINVTGNADIINMLNNSEYLVVFTLSDTFSSMLQSSLPTDTISLSMGPFINPSISIQQVSQYQKSISIFTLSLMQYLIHKSLLSIIFSTNCLSPCRSCIFQTNSSTQVSSVCRTCNTNMWLYNGTCLAVCPINTYESSVVDDSNNTHIIDICVSCQSQCASCMDNVSCSTCDASGTYKYMFVNLTVNTTTCLSQCPLDGYYGDAINTTNITTNVTTTSSYECLQCKENCSLCTNSTDCYKCVGSLLLYTFTCVQTCPIDTIQLILPTILFQNTTISNVSVCQTCAVYTNDTNCQYCSQSSGCISCKADYSLDYLLTRKCVTQCADGYFKTMKQSTTTNSNNSTYTYSVCELCDIQCATCSQSPNNCITCTWVDNTTNSQYYQLGNSCYLAANCPIESYPNSTTKTCASCVIAITGCVACQSSTNCTLCNATAGYYNFTNTTTTAAAAAGNNNTTVSQSSSVCLTASQIPKGYILINGSIQQCAQYCTDCSVMANNCTDCITGYYVYNLATGIGQCVSSCPSGYYPANYKLCTPCPSPCETCTITPANVSQILCSTCLISTGLYYYNNTCINSTSCPNTTYPYTDPDTQQRICKSCENNCTECTQDGSTCTRCMLPYYLYNSSCVLQAACPSGTVGIVNTTDNSTTCALCTNNCLTCINMTSICTSCQPTYYFIQQNNTCVQSCPSPLIKNQQNMTCVHCTSPCSTCQNIVTNCTSCVSGYFKYINQCVTSGNCPIGYYDNSTTGNCQSCPIECVSCSISSNLLTCQQCKSSYVLYNGSCLSSCPSEKPYDISGVCMSCSQALTGCQSCTTSQLAQMDVSVSLDNNNTAPLTNSNSIEQIVSSSTTPVLCTSCTTPYILLNSSCVTSCPSNYILKSTQCITIDQNADNILSQTLTNTTIMPLPLTIISVIIMMACLLSKLQNQNSYIIGAIYSLVGIVETGSVGYLILRVVSSGDQLKTIWTDNYNIIMLLFFICLGWIYATNAIAMIIQAYLLSRDEKFNKYTKHHVITYAIVSFISVLTNYKFKLIILTKLFDFSCFKCQLQSVQKFNIFNLFSFFGICHQGLLLYITGLVMAKYRAEIGNEFFLTILDVAIVAGINCVLAIVVSRKGEDFFQERYQGIVINRKIDVGVEEETYDFNKMFHQTPKANLTAEHFLSSSEKKRNLDSLISGKKLLNPLPSSTIKPTQIQDSSNQNLMQQISQDDQFSLSISHADQAQSRKSRKNIFDQNEQGQQQKSMNKQQRENSQDEEQGGMKSSSQLKGRVNMLPGQGKLISSKLQTKNNNNNNKASASTGVIMRSFKSLQNLGDDGDGDISLLAGGKMKMNKNQMNRRCNTQVGQEQEGYQGGADGMMTTIEKHQQLRDNGREGNNKVKENLQHDQVVDDNNDKNDSHDDEELILQEVGVKQLHDLSIKQQQQQPKQEYNQQPAGQLDRLPQIEQKYLTSQDQDNKDIVICHPNIQSMAVIANSNVNLQQQGLQQQQQQQQQQQPNIISNIITSNEQPLKIQAKQKINQSINDRMQEGDIIIVKPSQQCKQNQLIEQQQQLQKLQQQQSKTIDGVETNVVRVEGCGDQKVIDKEQIIAKEQNIQQGQVDNHNDKVAIEQPEKKDQLPLQQQQSIQYKQQQSIQNISIPMIEHGHLANNFFNQPLAEQTILANPTMLMEEKKKQLQRLRMSRKHLQEQNIKLKKKKQRRQRSRSIQGHEQKEQKEQNKEKQQKVQKVQIGEEGDIVNQDIQLTRSQVEQMKINVNIQSTQLVQVQNQSNIQSALLSTHQLNLSSNRLTARQILSMASSSSTRAKFQHHPYPSPTLNQQHNQQPPINNQIQEIILLDDSQQLQHLDDNNYRPNTASNVYDRTVSRLNMMEKKKMSKEEVMELQQQGNEEQKRRVDELLTARYNENRKQRKIMTEEEMETKMKNYTRVDSRNNNLKINISNNNRVSDEENQLIKKHNRSNSKSKTNLNNQNFNSNGNTNINTQQQQVQKQQQKQQEPKRIDLGEFIPQKEQEELDEQEIYYQSRDRKGDNNRRSRKRVGGDSKDGDKNNTNTKPKQQPREIQINSVDRISHINKIHPITSRPPITNQQSSIQLRQHNQTAIHDTSFISSGKSNQTHYPLYYKNKQLGYEKDRESSVDISFYKFNNQQGNQFYQQFSNQQSVHQQQHQQHLNEMMSEYGNGINGDVMQLRDNEEMSQHSNQLYLYTHDGKGFTRQNPQPTKRSTLPIPKYPPSKTKKISDNDQLSKLIAKNRNTIMTPSHDHPTSFKRSSIEKTTLQFNQRRQTNNSINSKQQRNMSAGGNNNNMRKSIQRGGDHRGSTKQMRQQTDALDEYYHRGDNQRQRSIQSGKSINDNLNRSRSRSKERPMSKQSQNKLKALQKIYLQKLQWKK